MLSTCTISSTSCGSSKRRPKTKFAQTRRNLFFVTTVATTSHPCLHVSSKLAALPETMMVWFEVVRFLFRSDIWTGAASMYIERSRGLHLQSSKSLWPRTWPEHFFFFSFRQPLAQDDILVHANLKHVHTHDPLSAATTSPGNSSASFASSISSSHAGILELSATAQQFLTRS